VRPAGSAARAATPSATSSGHAYVPVAGPAKGPVSRPGAVSRPQGITPTNFPLVTGQRTLSAANLTQQVRAALLVPPSARTTKTPSTQLRGCVGTLASGHQLKLVESVRFEGRPATLVVARTGAEDTAWIAAPDCSDTYRHVLATTTLSSGISGP